MFKFVKGLVKDRKGQAMVEYALILALVSIVAIYWLTQMGDEVSKLFQTVYNALFNART